MSSDDDRPSKSDLSKDPSSLPTRPLRVRIPSTTSAHPSYDRHYPATPTSAPRKRVRASQTPEVMERVRMNPGYVFFVDLVERLYVKPEAEGFRAPVLDLWEESAVPGYLNVIDTPMDLGTIKTRLKEGHYNRYHPVAPFIDEDWVMRDIRLVFQNCMQYNDSDSDFFRIAKDLLTFANKAVKPRLAQRREEARIKEEQQRERKQLRDRERRARLKAEKLEREREEAKVKAEQEERERELERRKKRKRERDAERRAMKKEQEMQKRHRDAERRARLKAQKQAEAEAKAKAEQVVSAREAARSEDVRMHAENGIMEHEVDEDGQTPNRKWHKSDGPPNEFTPNGKKVRVRRDDDARSTSSISSDEVAEIEVEIEVDDEEVREMQLEYVTTTGMEKKRGRKSAAAQSLETKHDGLMRQRRQLLEARMELNRRRQTQLNDQEKRELCAKVRVLGCVQMKCVVQIIAEGMNRLDIIRENEVDIDINRVDTRVLRDVQFFLENPALVKALESLTEIERKLTDIEAEYVSYRYQRVSRHF